MIPGPSAKQHMPVNTGRKGFKNSIFFRANEAAQYRLAEGLIGSAETISPQSQ
jgi:hypothetical protein